MNNTQSQTQKKLVLNRETLRNLQGSEAKEKKDGQAMISDMYTRTCTRACD
jgi:hypothetical protein